ncbi:site-specific integrase [archaeon]|nr:site-specific integrase [archaeon]
MKKEIRVKRGTKIDVLLKGIPQSEIDLIDSVLVEIKEEVMREQTVRDKYRTPLITLRYALDKNFLDSQNKKDAKALNNWIANTTYSVGKKGQFRTAIKYAYRVWLGLDEDDDEPDFFKYYKQKKKEKKLAKGKKTYMPKLSNLIKTNEDMDAKIICNLKTNRDKLYFSKKWDDGARDTESRFTKWDDIFTDINGHTKIKIQTAKYSGDSETRELMLFYCLPFLHRWKKEYMEIFGIENEKELSGLYIFRKATNKDNTPLCHGHYVKLCKNMREPSGIPDLSPKMFRKYAISQWEREGIPEPIIRKMSGHCKTSDAIAHYSYHNQEDMDKNMAKLNGIEIRKHEISSVVPAVIDCRRCERPNRGINKHCESCGFPLSKEAINTFSIQKQEANVTEMLIAKNPKLKEEFISLLKEQIKAEILKEIA